MVGTNSMININAEQSNSYTVKQVPSLEKISKLFQVCLRTRITVSPDQHPGTLINVKFKRFPWASKLNKHKIKQFFGLFYCRMSQNPYYIYEHIKWDVLWEILILLWERKVLYVKKFNINYILFSNRHVPNCLTKSSDPGTQE